MADVRNAKGGNLLEVSHLTKGFKIGSLLSRKKLTAVDDVSFTMPADHPVILSIVGESGCGKSTLCKMVLRLLDIDGGNIKLDGHNYVEKYNPPEVYKKKVLFRMIGTILIVLGLITALVGAYGMYHLNIMSDNYDVGFNAARAIISEYPTDGYIEKTEALPDDAEEPASDLSKEEKAELSFRAELDARGYRGMTEDYLIAEEIEDLEDEKNYEEGQIITVGMTKVKLVANLMKAGVNVFFIGLGVFLLGIIVAIIANISSYPFRVFRMDVQPIFQNPFEAFSARKTVDTYLFNTARRLGIAKNKAEAEARADDALRQVGLSLDVVRGKYATQFSGGELQRVSIARALITKPKIIIADEPVAMIDASMKMNIVNLFKELRDNYGISFIYITHDLSTAYYVSDYIATLYRGCLIEYGSSKDIMVNPAHPYTKLLMDSVPRVGDKWEQDVAMPDMEDKEYSVTHCKFASRCPYVTEECLRARPDMIDLGGEREVLCFHPLVQ